MARWRVMVVGAGGREHALAWRLARDPEVDEVLVAPGNDGLGRSARRIAVADCDADGLIAASLAHAIDLVVIGPEVPLAAGVADRMRAAGLAVYGPGAEAARLESSKWYAKRLMRECGVATARAELFTALDPAREALARFEPPWVLKADGLAAGKGVMVTPDLGEAGSFIADCLEGVRFGAAGRSVVIEEFLEGEEVSVMAVACGAAFVMLPSARDYKRAYDADHGPNTGGMGACAPSPAFEPGRAARVADEVLGPVLGRLDALGTPFRGTLYAGLMLTARGPMVVEFNCRFGDPETQVVLPLVEGRFAALLAGAAAGSFDPEVVASIRPASGATVAVAIVDQDYPLAPRGGGRIEGLDRLARRDDLHVFHAAAAFERGEWTVRGGRAAWVVARAATHAEARARVYGAIGTLSGNGWRCRSDIAAGVGRGERSALARAADGGGA
jgi:phosphoribosylamine--glycine ligase